MIVIDNIGKVADMYDAADSVNRLLLREYHVNDFSLEQIFKESDVVRLYNRDGHLTEDIVEAAFKIVELKGLVSSREGFQICGSFVKSHDAVKRWGHASDDVWNGAFIGSEERLYSKWLSKQIERGYIKQDTSRSTSSDSTIGAALQQSGVLEKLHEVVDNTVESNVIHQTDTYKNPSGYDDFLEELYDLLYMKESWKDKDGKLSRLYKYLNYLGIKIIKDKNRERYLSFTMNKKRVMFNTRLLDRYGNYILVSARNDGTEFNGYSVIRSFDDAKAAGFTSNIDIPPIPFFNQLSEVVFTGTIDDFDTQNLHRLYHVIEERKTRLPKELRKLSSIDINMRLMASIDMALKIAKTDYKFIVPKYNPEKNNIDFLVPVYTSFDGESKPECALVVDKNSAGKWEIRTVLEIEEAYNNARLVNRPDQSWLTLEDKTKVRKPRKARVSKDG